VTDKLAITFEERFQNGLARLRRFAEENGHCEVPLKYVEPDGYRLGSWVHRQQIKVLLTMDRIRALETVPGWRWPVELAHWQREDPVLNDYLEEVRKLRTEIAQKAPAMDASSHVDQGNTPRAFERLARRTMNKLLLNHIESMEQLAALSEKALARMGLGKAGRQEIKHLLIAKGYQVHIEEEQVTPPPTSADLNGTPIEFDKLSLRIANRLRANNIGTVEKLAELTQEDMDMMGGLGSRSREEIALYFATARSAIDPNQEPVMAPAPALPKARSRARPGASNLLFVA
jgi:hypothetical protein